MVTREVLLVDDCLEDREIYHRYLLQDKHHTYKILEASTGKEALEICRQQFPDMIVTDYLLLDMDGLELIENLKTQFGQTKLPIIVITGQGSEQVAVQAMKSGAADYLVKKNTTADSLCRAIDNVLIEKTRLSRQLAESEGRFQATFNQAAVGIAHVGLDGQWLLVNQKLCDIVGYTDEELQTLTFQDITHPDDLNADLEYIRQILTGEIETYALEKRYIRKDNTQVWINLTVSLVRSSFGEPEYFISVVQDITASKRAEAALRESEEQRRLVLDLTQTGFWDWNIATGETIWNENHYHLLGLIPNSVEVSYQIWRDRVHPEDIARVEQTINYALTTQTEYETEYRVIHPDGSHQPVMARGRGIYDESGQAVRMIGMLFDISDHKLTQLNKQFLNELDGRLRQLSDTDAIVWQAIKSLGEYLNVERVVWQEVNLQEDVITITQDWRQQADIKSVVGTYRLSEFIQPNLVEYYQAGQPAVVSDVTNYADTAAFAHNFAEQDIRAFVGVPCFYEGRWVALLSINARRPQMWRPDQVALLQASVTRLCLIIEQTKAVQALRESEEKYRSLFNSIDEGYVLLDVIFDEHDQPIDLLYVDANPAAVKMTGAELVGRRTRELDPNFEAQWFETLGRVAKTGIGERHEFYTAPLQSWYNFYVFKVGESGSPQVALLYQDITERKQAQEKIREQAALIDVATDAIFVHDLENQILFWNRGSERLYGWTAEESVGIAHEIFQRESSPQLQVGLEATIEHGSWQGELAQITKAGREIIVASRWTLVHNQFGQPQSILVVNTDITEKKQLEQQFYRTQRLESIGTLASGIAHDLNNVFAPIMMIAQLLPLKCQDVDARTQELFQTLDNISQRGANLVKQILTFARGTDSKNILLQPAYLLQELVKVIKQTFPKSIEVIVNIPTDTLWMVQADPTQLEQVFMNLAVNARDAMPTGGILTITAENRIIDETYAQMRLEAKAGGYIVVTVSDTGAGIPPEFLDRIFDPFFTTKEVGKGTGLGLSTVLGIVKNYRGFVEVSTQIGKGTQFQVFLPKGYGATTNIITNAQIPKGNSELILVVDDEAVIQQITQATLADYNYKTLVANDGIDAIALYLEHQLEISAILLDMSMPNMDGLTAIRTLIALNPKLKIIAVSGLPANEQKAMAAGASKFLSKPYTATDLLTTLSEVMAMC